MLPPSRSEPRDQAATAALPGGRLLFPAGAGQSASPAQRRGVVEVLKSARMAQLELAMDNNERMVLRINNEELLPILEALQKALSRVRVEHP